MSLFIDLTPTEEAQLSAAAMQTGLEPEAFAAKLVREHLPSAALSDTELDAKLRQLQAQDHTNLMPSRTTAEFFAQWADDEAYMTNEGCEAEEGFWEDFQKGINETRAALGMRQL